MNALQHPGISNLVFNTTSWLPELTDHPQRIAAAVAYVKCRRAGQEREISRRSALAAATGSPDDLNANLQAIIASEAAARAEQERIYAAKREQERIEREQQMALAILPPAELLKRARKHTEKCRWHNFGTWRHRRWALDRQGKSCALPDDPPFTQEANETIYQHLVSILNRRATNSGGGVRTDITAETPNDPRKVALCRSILARKHVSPKRLLAIPDAHARAWAIEQCGGWGRMTRALPVVEKTKDGTLLDGRAAALDKDLLLVKCPSTGQRYVLMVPQPTRRPRTVANALRAVNGIAGDRLIAQS